MSLIQTTARPVHRNRLRSVLVAVIASVLAIAAAAPAASEAASEGVSGAQCPGELTQPFLPWGDDDPYRLTPGGDFETGAEGWELSEGAELISDSGPLGGDTALSLDKKASAVSAPICIDGSEDHSRMFSRGEDREKFSLVKVDVISPDGRDHPIGMIRSGDEWEPTTRLLVPRWWSSTGIDSFQYRFTAIGRGTTVLDDLYIDPRRRN